MDALAPYRKAVVGFVAAIGILISGGFLPADVNVWVDAVLAVLIPFGIYVVPNSSTPGAHAAP